MLGIAMNRAGATQAALAAGFVSASCEMKTIGGKPSPPVRCWSPRRAATGAPVPRKRTTAFGPGNQIAVVIRVGESVHHAQDGDAFAEQSNADRASPPAFEVS